MLISRFYPYPRFALPLSAGDCAAALLGAIRRAPEPGAFGLLGSSPKFWTRSGRQALWMLLRGLNLKPGSGVALPIFTDPSLMRAIAAAGHIPIFIDVDPKRLTMNPDHLKAKRGTFSAVVAVHLFGHVADMPPILQCADGVPVIEDAAHAPFSYLDGQMAGRFGVAAFYSFASTKYWPAGGGGLAVVHDQRLAEEFAKIAEPLERPTMMRKVENLALLLAKAAVFARGLYGIAGKPMRRMAEKWALLEPQLDMKTIMSFQAVLAQRQARRMPQRVEQQRLNSLRLLSQLRTLQDVVLPEERPGARYNYHIFPILLKNRDERQAMTASLWQKCVDSSMLYSNSIVESRPFGYSGECPAAESIADRIITLPNHASLTTCDVDYIAHALISSLRTYRNASPRCHSCRLLPNANVPTKGSTVQSAP